MKLPYLLFLAATLSLPANGYPAPPSPTTAAEPQSTPTSPSSTPRPSVKQTKFATSRLAPNTSNFNVPLSELRPHLASIQYDDFAAGGKNKKKRLHQYEQDNSSSYSSSSSHRIVRRSPEQEKGVSWDREQWNQEIERRKVGRRLGRRRQLRRELMRAKREWEEWKMWGGEGELDWEGLGL